MQRDPHGHSEGRSPARFAGSDEDFLRLGVTCTTGAEAPVDLVSAHKWFNLAAMLGNQAAARWRREVAAEMTTAEITTAQRAARDWITTH